MLLAIVSLVLLLVGYHVPAALAADAACQAGCEGMVDTVAAAEQGAATLVARVRRAILGGAVPPPSATSGLPQDVGPVAGAAVQVVPAEDPTRLVAEQVADVDGQAAFALPPGRYWVFVPWGDPAARSMGANLPDGRPVSAWSEALVPPDGAVEVTLRAVLALP